ncbi:hypothetical protein ACO2I3_04875 [Leptospira interrogans]
MRLGASGLVLFAAIMLGAAGVRADSEKGSKCFSNWSEAAQVVKKEQLVDVEQLNRFAQARLGGKIVRSTLCAIGQRFLYRVVVRPANGPLKSLAIDAREPSKP